jgi:hypothetical protein
VAYICIIPIVNWIIGYRRSGSDVGADGGPVVAHPLLPPKRLRPTAPSVSGTAMNPYPSSSSSSATGLLALTGNQHAHTGTALHVDAATLAQAPKSLQPFLGRALGVVPMTQQASVSLFFLNLFFSNRVNIKKICDYDCVQRKPWLSLPLHANVYSSSIPLPLMFILNKARVLLTNVVRVCLVFCLKTLATDKSHRV